jgi:hypothetical protein
MLVACSGDGDGTTVWYRVSEAPGGWLIARADPEADTCHLLGISSLGVPTFVFEDVDVNVDGVYAGGLYERGDARGCQTNLDYAMALADASAFGQIRFKQTTMMNGMINACRVDVDVTATGVRFLADDVYVWDSGCEPWPSDTTYYTSLDAAYVPEAQTLIVAGWDPANEACAWINFNIAVDSPVPSTIDAPSHWIVDQAIIALVTEGECDAVLLAAESPSSEWMAFGRDEFGDGTLSFTDSEAATIDGAAVELPCKINIDARVPFFATHYWAPMHAGFRAQDVPVVGACP